MSKPGLNCVNNEAIFNQKHTLKLFIPFRMAYLGCFSLGEILIFQNSSKKKLQHQPQGPILQNSSTLLTAPRRFQALI